jgi:RHS repeat-associated protein
MAYPDGEQVATTYNAQGLPATLGTYITASSYSAASQLTSLTFGNNVVTTNYTYHAENLRLMQLTTTNNLQNLSYQYDNVGNVTKITDVLRNNEETRYEYDNLDRLKKAYITGVYTQEWDYTAIGNINWRKDNGVTTSYTYNPSTRPHAVMQVGTTAYNYDANGNMTARGSDALLYDQENRLYRVTVGGTQTDYTYNADSARVKKVVGGTATYYVGNWYEVTNNVATKYYYFGAQRVAMKQGSAVTYLHGDHLGSTSVASNASGALVSRQTYYAFGAVRTTEGTLPTDYTFTGQKNDAASALMFYNARYYDPGIGRFTQADTIVPDPGNPQTLNRYAYTLNNPLKYIDPSGHDIILVGGANSDGKGDPWDDPSGEWETWIREYTGWTHDQFLEKFYNPWMNSKTDEEKMKIAQETGVAVFKWDAVWGAEQFGSVYEAAQKLQQQINDWGLKDVTIVGGSKGGKVIETLLGMYEYGWLAKGEVKNMVAVDPPQGIFAITTSGNPTPGVPNAIKAGVGVASISAWASCSASPPCNSNIKNDMQFSPSVNNHSLHSYLAPQVFSALGIAGDAHARPVLWGW